MKAKERQKALDNIPSEDLAKLKAHQASTSGAYPVDEEWVLLAEFAMTFGWDAYLAVKNDSIKLEEVLTLIEASRKVKAVDHYKAAHAALIGAASASAKKPAVAFRSLTKDILKQAKVLEP